jgi:hypothetical protein
MIRLISAIIIMLYYWLFQIKSYGKLLIFSTSTSTTISPYGVGNINLNMTATLPSRGSSGIIMPPIVGRYTSMMLQVQQNSAARST